MADIRIKDLGTTAASAASDDYLAVDGVTNATRKILASKFVAAPGSTTDNAVVRYDGTAGQVQNSGVTIDDSGNLTVGSGSADAQTVVNGSNSGATGGASVNVRNAGATIFAIGNQSNVIGGGYSAVPMIYFDGSPLRFYSALGGANAMTLSSGGNLNTTGNITVSGTQNVFGVPASADALATNSTMTFELTSNTSFKIKVRGTDGITRSVTLTLS